MMRSGTIEDAAIAGDARHTHRCDAVGGDAQEEILSAGLREGKRIGAADLSDVSESQLVHRSIRAVWEGAYVAGPAYTVRIPPGDHRGVLEAIGVAPEGSVLVVDAGGADERAVFGEISALAAIQCGLAGVVIDGYLRDSDAIRELRFPAFALGALPTAPRPRQQGALRKTVMVGGAVIEQGDLIVADGDGVVAVSAESAGSALIRAGRLVAHERDIAAALRRSTPVSAFTEHLQNLREGQPDTALVSEPL